MTVTDSRSSTRALLRPQIIGVADDALAKWDASIPATFGPTEASAAVESALAQSDATVREVKSQYHGTIPPPPWPATPDLVKARETMLGAETFFAKIGEAAPDSRWKRTDKAGVALLKAGQLLFTETAKLQKASENAPALKDFLKAVPDPRFFAAVDWRRAVLIAAGLYIVAPEARRFVRRTLGRVLR